MHATTTTLSPGYRTAWTRLETVVVALVLGMLAILAIGAIVDSRESSRRSRCADHLRQIGVALLTYHDTQRVLPPVAFRDSNSLNLDIRTSNGQAYYLYPTYANWIILLLPYLGEAGLAAAFDWRVPVTDPANAGPRTTELAILTCPSDGYHQTDNFYCVVPEQGSSSEFARGNYGINAGVDEDNLSPGDPWRPAPNGLIESVAGTIDRPVIQVWGSGIAGFNKSLSLDDFTNGSSNLVGVDELRSGLIPDDGRGVWALGEVGACATRLHGLAGDDCGPNCRHPNADDTCGCSQVQQAWGKEALVQEGMPCAAHAIGPQATARSMHPGGVNALLMDGSTRFLRDSIDGNLWHILHSRLSRNVAVPTAFAPPSRSAADAASSQPPLAQHPLPSGIDTITNVIGMVLVRVPAGQFTMALSDEGEDAVDQITGTPPWAPPHRVTIPKDFYLGTFEVTQQQYERIMSTNPSWHRRKGPGKYQVGTANTADYPVEQVSWVDAVTFCGRLSQMPEEQAAGRRYRLPTEAEWEYACRSGSEKRFQYPQGQEAQRMGFNMRPMATSGLPITAVGTYPPNVFGLYDMRGNVWEWCADWYGQDYYSRSPPVDPQGPASGTFRVVRGADWRFTGPGCNLTRFDTEPWKTNPYIGFRVACDRKRP